MKKFAKITAVVLVAVMALAVLVACGYPSDPDKAKEKLEKQGYTIIMFNENPTGLSDYKAMITASKLDDDNNGTMIAITYFKDADAAKKAYDEAKKNLDEHKADYKEAGIKASVSRSGNQVVTKMSGNLEDMF